MYYHYQIFQYQYILQGGIEEYKNLKNKINIINKIILHTFSKLLKNNLFYLYSNLIKNIKAF